MFPTATVSGTPNNPKVSHGEDSNLVVRFYFNKIEEKPYVRINIPGDQKTEYDRPANELDKRRFKSKWDQFQAQQQQTDGQTDILEMGISEAIAKHLANFHITTVEQLANLNDTFITQVGMGTRELQKKAMNYMNEIKGRKMVHDMEVQLKQRDTQNALLQEKIEQLSKQYAELADNVQIKKGRKKAE